LSEARRSINIKVFHCQIYRNNALAERIYFCNRLDITARHDVKKGEKRGLLEQKLQLLHELFTASTDNLKKVGIQEYKSLCEE